MKWKATQENNLELGGRKVCSGEEGSFLFISTYYMCFKLQLGKKLNFSSIKTTLFLLVIRLID